MTEKYISEESDLSKRRMTKMDFILDSYLINFIKKIKYPSNVNNYLLHYL